MQKASPNLYPGSARVRGFLKLPRVHPRWIEFQQPVYENFNLLDAYGKQSPDLHCPDQLTRTEDLLPRTYVFTRQNCIFSLAHSFRNLDLIFAGFLRLLDHDHSIASLGQHPPVWISATSPAPTFKSGFSPIRTSPINFEKCWHSLAGSE